MRRVLASLCVLSSLLGACGCGTIASHITNPQDPHVFGGVEVDCAIITESLTGNAYPESNNPKGPQRSAVERGMERLGFSLLGITVATIDLPLSLIADAVSLPVTIGSRHWWWDCMDSQNRSLVSPVNLPAGAQAPATTQPPATQPAAASVQTPTNGPESAAQQIPANGAVPSASPTPQR
jgi:uncharacterized protein YceK